MTAINEVPLGHRFSFEVYPTAVLGSNFRDVRLEGILSPEMAMAFGADIASLHANVYPSLPAGVPNDPMQYNYFRIRLANGSFMILGVPWVRQESIVLSEGGNLYLTFSNRTQTDLDRILLSLSSIGQSPDDVKFT